jgi:5-methylcytosine-specific restriction enzyme B
MSIQAPNWQTELQTWLQQHPKTIPNHLRQLREEFVLRFPIETLKNMTLEQYAVGKPDSFCYWLEFKTRELGSIGGGSSAKFGVWWSKSEGR